jgi:hypothetical protein
MDMCESCQGTMVPIYPLLKFGFFDVLNFKKEVLKIKTSLKLLIII